ncbi:hypothetical protein GH714_017756 [Hevea brasiliensis]|uniref:Uncharacterized protein n=1 Tax=Hevea brasiliensis TaxID=3981 RepID=A0A6A6KQP1_HEVBR|nr:hypothetical protein GH714_017756 [Hevea brasiliensis]
MLRLGLNEYNSLLKSLKSRRHLLYSRLSEVLVAKGKADDQLNWRVIQNEKLASLREKLCRNKEQLIQGKAKIERISYDLNVKYGVLESAQSVLQDIRVEKQEKFFPNLIYTQSLGHMAITSELLHKQSVIVKQICKLFPQRRVIIEGEEKMSKVNMIKYAMHAYLEDLILILFHQKSLLLPWAMNSWNYTFVISKNCSDTNQEPLLLENRYMVQLLNLVVGNLAAPALHNSGFAGSCSRIWQRDSYWNAYPSSRSNEYPLFIPRQNYCSTSSENSWTDRSSSLDVPSEASTFEAFAKLLATLSSSKEIRSGFSLKMACSRSCNQVQKLNKSVWNVNSTISSTTLLESAHALHLTKNIIDNNFQIQLPVSYLQLRYDAGKTESLIDGWDLWNIPLFLLLHHKLKILNIGFEPCLLMQQRNKLVEREHQSENSFCESLTSEVFNIM